MFKKEKIKIFIIIVILITLFCLFFLTLQIKSKDNIPSPTTNLKLETPPPNLAFNEEKEKREGQTTLEVNETKYGSEIVGTISVYDFMEKLRKEGKINFKDKTYSGMGKFIEEINGIKNSGEKNWIYYVNGQKANIGISNYKINKGDTVSWKYEK